MTTNELKEKNPILGTQLISKKEFEYTLLSRYGLKIYEQSITKYRDLYSCNKHAYSIDGPNVFTCAFTDRFGFAISDVNGEFYKEHYQNKTELYQDFKEYISKHTIKIKNHFFI